ncbi:TenA family protein [Leptolyngbya iicbica]|uniref:TenA family protein n=2 Tax=Cyanophyceae TaxID=3028117 RepID=A0A4Q7DZY1_9CYAN|nr:TenA family protein [Leptolyngbya sp. LK]RZM74718.1 TenA family protein [Leptolyngbya sp. LK]
MTLSQRLWQANQDLAQACLTHPFVQGIYDGTLPRDTFAYYVGQDAFFLEAFARAYSVAAAKAPDWPGFMTFHELAGGVLHELKLHGHYAKAWGVDLSAVHPGGATRRYTDFLLATAWQQTAGLTAIAMSPCMRLYAFIGQSLASQGIPTHEYGDWVRTYSSQDFEPLAAQLETLVDQYSPDNELAAETFRYAMQCEYDFFDAAWQVGE